MKKIIVFLTVIALFVCVALLFAFRKISPDHTKSYNITFIRMKEGGQFWSSMRNGVREARTDTHSVVDFYSTVKASDVSMQIEYIHKAVEKGTDCIVITPCTYYLLKKPLEEAEKSGIKIISLYNEYDKSPDSSSVFYMTDLQPAGRAMAQKIVRNMQTGPIDAIIVSSFETESSEKYLAEGFSDVLKTVPDAKCRILYAGRDIDSISNQIVDSYTQDPNCNLFFALNGETSEGLMKALKIINPDKKIYTVVSSNSLINIENLEIGDVDYILVINSFAMGYQSIYAAIDLIKGKTVKKVPVDFTIVDKSHMFAPDIQKKLFLLP